jgi:hypothetical protein
MMEDLSPPPTRTPPRSSCPFQLLKKQAEQNSSRIKKKKNKEDDGGGEETLVDDEDVINAFVVFNQDLASRDHCINRVHRKKHTQRLVTVSRSSIKTKHSVLQLESTRPTLPVTNVMTNRRLTLIGCRQVKR